MAEDELGEESELKAGRVESSCQIGKEGFRDSVPH